MLLGREAESKRLRQLMDTAAGGERAVLLLSGEPGVGKTSLLRQAIGIARPSGLTVLHARGDESETDLPYAGLHALLLPLLPRLDALPAPQAVALRGALALGPPAANHDRFATYLGVFSLLAGAAAERPLLCVLDDAQWLDPDSLRAIVFAARRLEADAVALLIAARTGHNVTIPGADQLVLAPLQPVAARALVDRCTGGCATSMVAEELVRDAEGNPLALIESARALTDDKRARRLGNERPLTARTSAERLFGGRIAALSAAARKALLVAAAADSQVGPVLHALGALGADAHALQEAEAAGLVSVGDGRLAFCHPLARSAAYAAGSPAERRAAHEALAGAVDGPRRALHRARAAFGPDDEVAQELEDSAREARRRGGFAAAASVLERAASLSVDSRAQARRRFLAADAARLAGQHDQAENLLVEAAHAAVDGDLYAAIQHARGRLALINGRAEAAGALLATEAERRAAYEPAQAATMLAEAAFAALVGGNQDAAMLTARRAQALAGPGDVLAAVATELMLGTVMLRGGDVAEGLRRVQDAARLAEAGLDRGLDPEYAAHVAHALSWAGDYQRARLLVDRVVTDARSAGALGILPWALYVQSDLHTRTGRWSDALAAAWEAARIAEETGNAFWRCYALAALALVEATQGREDECHAHAAEAVEVGAELGIEPPRKIRDALGLLELGAGRPEEAIVHFESAGPFGSRLTLPDLVESYVRAQRPVPEGVPKLLACLDPVQPATRAFVRRCRGLLAEGDEWEALFIGAVDDYESAGMPFGAARTALLLGERLRRVGRRVDARVYLRAAAERFDRLGATPWVKRTEAELRASGETAARRGYASEEQLTAQELQVALVVARGATNREAGAKLFLSPKTIDYHLGRVYRKLGVRSRTELAQRFPAAPRTDT